MAIKTDKLKGALINSLRTALDKAIQPVPADASQAVIDAKAVLNKMLSDVHLTIATEFGTQASLAIEEYVKALEIDLKDLKVNIPAGQDVHAQDPQSLILLTKIGVTSAPTIGTIPADQTKIGKIV